MPTILCSSWHEDKALLPVVSRMAASGHGSLQLVLNSCWLLKTNPSISYAPPGSVTGVWLQRQLNLVVQEIPTHIFT